MKISGKMAGNTVTASNTSPFSNATNPRCIPQPGQSYPVSSLNGHLSMWDSNQDEMLSNISGKNTIPEDWLIALFSDEYAFIFDDFKTFYDQACFFLHSKLLANLKSPLLKIPHECPRIALS